MVQPRSNTRGHCTYSSNDNKNSNNHTKNHYSTGGFYVLLVVDMWNYLAELGVHQNEVHPALGKIDDELRSFVQKK